MQTLVLYYSLSGTTRAEAERLAAASGASLEEIRELHRRNIFTSFIPGCPNAMKRKASKILPLHMDLNAYDRIVLCAPVWAGFPAPAFNAAVQLLPPGKEIDIVLCSGSGETPKSIVGTKNLILARGCRLISYRDVCTAPEQGKK